MDKYQIVLFYKNGEKGFIGYEMLSKARQYARFRLEDPESGVVGYILYNHMSKIIKTKKFPVGNRQIRQEMENYKV